MSESNPISSQSSSNSLKRFGAKVLRWILVAFGFLAFGLVRVVLAVLFIFAMVIIGLLMPFMGPNRILIILDYVSKQLRRTSI